MPVSKEKQKELQKKAETEVDLEKVIADLPGLIAKSVQEGMSGLIQSMQANNKNTTDENDGEDDEEVDNPLEGVDLEKISKGDLAKLINEQVTANVNKELKKFGKNVDEQITSTKTVLTKEQLVRELKDLREKYPDFDHFKDSIAELAKTRKGLPVEDLYHLARARNPDKVKELDDERLEKETEKRTEAEKKFGGLTPTSYSESKSKGTMSQKEASEAAWEEAMADVPTSAIGGGND